MRRASGINISNNTRHTIPRVPFAVIKNKVLGQDYDLSLAFVGEKASRRLNRAYRGKDKSANVLGFALSKKSGEVIINLPRAKKESSLFGASPRSHVARLFIHALLHLKGLPHGSKMESEKTKLQKLFEV